MQSRLVIALGMVACSVGSRTVMAQELPANAKAKIELRWIETEKIEGVTEEEGFKPSDEPNSIAYAHNKAVMVLTAAEVTEVRLRYLDLSRSGWGDENYDVTFQLTKQARERLVTACGDQDSRTLSVFIDGERGPGLKVFHKLQDPRTSTEYDAFVGSVKRAEAVRLLDAFWDNQLPLMQMITEWQYPGSAITRAQASDGATIDAGGKRTISSTIRKTLVTTDAPIEKVIDYYRAKFSTKADVVNSKISDTIGRSVVFSNDAENRPFSLHTILVNTGDTSTTLVISRGKDEDKTHIAWKQYRRFGQKPRG